MVRYLSVRCARTLAVARGPSHTPVMLEIPETRYAKTADGTHIACATLGAGPADLVYIALTVGSGLMIVDAGEHELKGAPDLWRLYRVVG